jgi:hypothetical protein
VEVAPGPLRPRDRADRLRLSLPPGTARWSKIEHRLFSFVSINWPGRALTDIRTIVELIAATATTTGLSVQCAYDPNWYTTGEKISDRNFGAIPLKKHEWHGDWIYDIAPDMNLASVPTAGP